MVYLDSSKSDGEDGNMSDGESRIRCQALKVDRNDSDKVLSIRCGLARPRSLVRWEAYPGSR